MKTEDQDLPMIKNVINFLIKGIGVHHGGLLPIIKEITEILFQNDLVKVLFTTETFSMGVNMPCKTVVFTKLTKYDGSQFRVLSSGEYTQMSGRAGRRGKDQKGVSILMLESKMSELELKQLVGGNSDYLKSNFYISYNSLLNSLLVDSNSPDYLTKRSFLQFQV